MNHLKALSKSFVAFCRTWQEAPLGSKGMGLSVPWRPLLEATGLEVPNFGWATTVDCLSKHLHYASSRYQSDTVKKVLDIFPAILFVHRFGHINVREFKRKTKTWKQVYPLILWKTEDILSILPSVYLGIHSWRIYLFLYI